MKWNKSTLIGAAIAFIGLSILLRIFLGFSFPFIRLGIAIAFIYFGIRVALGTLGLGRSALGNTIFRLSGEITEKEELAVAFGSGSLDLSEATPPAKGDAEVELGVILGGGKIYYRPESPLEISVRCILGDATLPDGNAAFIGSLTYRTPGAASAERLIRLKITVFCGNVLLIAGSMPVEGPSDEAGPVDQAAPAEEKP